ncbi:MAG: GIY-YIG nuclease family protein [Opitutales bacterium]|nr:GIY-YIG nuclease family protein [Opitutales bacterium]
MPKQVSKEDLELLGELGVETTAKKQAARTPREQRIIAGYEEIERFVEQHGRMPEHGENRDIFERLYAVRLDRLRKSAECREVLGEIDRKRLLDVEDDVPAMAVNEGGAMDEALLEALGVAQNTSSDITQLTHVRSSQEKMAAEEIAQRTPCKNFGVFKPLFEQVQNDLTSGFRKTLKYQDNGEIKKGDFFIVEGQKAYVADWGEPFISSYNKPDRRLRVIYDNGTESDLLLRSMQRALNRDESSRRVTDPTLGPLFSDQEADDDQTVGYVYVLRSRSDNPFIAENRKVIHKIGITKGSVQQRVANASKDPTYLLADVEIVETYKVSNLDLKRLEKILHKFFDPARLDLQLKDRFGFGVEPREWFLVPLPIIEEAIQKLIDGTLPKYRYDPKEGQIKP